MISKELLIRAMNLTTAEVNQAMHYGGYTEKHTNAVFKGQTASGAYVYEVGYKSVETGAEEKGLVFLVFAHDVDGYYLAGDY
jgi:hypothetical protein